MAPQRGNGGLWRLLVGGAAAAMFRSKAVQNDPWLCRLRAASRRWSRRWLWADKIGRIA